MALNFHIILAITLMIIIQVPPNNAEIKTIRLSSDSRPTIILNDFCFGKNGRVSLSIFNVSIASTSTAQDMNQSRFSFLLLGLYYEMFYPRDDKKICIADDIGPSSINDTIATFDQLSQDLSLNKTSHVPRTGSYTGRYSIFFSNCQSDSSVSMSIVLESYNLNDDGTKDYLGTAETGKPKVFFIFALLYLPFIGIWTMACHINKAYARKIHVMMGFLLLAKALNLLCAAEESHYIKNYGISHFWDSMFYVSYFFQAILFLTSVMLIGSGWSVIKQYLTLKQKIVLFAGISFQIITNVSYIYNNENGPYTKKLWDWWLALLLVDFLGSAVIIVPIVMSVRYLKQSAKADGTAATTLARMTTLRNFLFCVLFYSMMTKMIKKIDFNFMDCYSGSESDTDACVEAITIIFYIVMFSFFRPMEENEFLVIQDEEIALAKIRTGFEDI